MSFVSDALNVATMLGVPVVIPVVIHQKLTVTLLCVP